jgi:hypothetical protein
MGLFRRKPKDRAVQDPPAPPEPFAVDGHGKGEWVCTVERKNDASIEVVGMSYHPDGPKAIAGRRPRDEDDLYREKTTKVRLVREPDNQYDPNAAAVVTDSGVMVGHVPKDTAKKIAPVLDGVLRRAAKKRKSVDIYCSAYVVAEWDDLDSLDEDDDKHEPCLCDVTLRIDGRNPSYTRLRTVPPRSRDLAAHAKSAFGGYTAGLTGGQQGPAAGVPSAAGVRTEGRRRLFVRRF